MFHWLEVRCSQVGRFMTRTVPPVSTLPLAGALRELVASLPVDAADPRPATVQKALLLASRL
jgi:hypothetical protein